MTKKPEPDKLPITPDAPNLADSVTVKAGVVAVRQWINSDKVKGQPCASS
ncbi:MAG: hypothetical protein QMB16_01700 [Paracoccaceae bacterium]|jgi:hypothetical protein